MHMLLQLPFLGLALFLSSALAATIPQSIRISTPTNPVNTTLGLNATSNGGFTCMKRSPQQHTEPRLADCAGVLRSLPLNPSIGTFYNSGRGDFQLPFFETHRTCTVLVELRSTFDKVQSSWLSVHMAAMELNEACQDVRLSPGLGYGYTCIDGSNSMKVTLKGPGRVGDGDDAGTAATETS